MGNIGGLRDAYDIKFQFSGLEGRPVTGDELLSLYRDIDDVNAAPGTTYIYNNAAWGLLLSLAIERITAQPLEEVLRKRIFEPVGMYDTLLRRWDTNFVPNSAAAHMMTPGGSYERAHFGLDMAGAGSVVSTVDDMLRWLAHMDTPRVGSSATWAVMKAPQTLANGTSTGYGLGLITDRYRGIERLQHSGGGLGSNAQMLKIPAVGLDVAIMVNRQDVLGLLLADKILDACLPGLNPTERSFSGPFPTGSLRSPNTGRVIQLSTSSHVPWNEGAIASIDGADLPVAPDENGVLAPVGICRCIKQAVTLIGDPVQPASIQFSDYGNLDELVAVNPAVKANIGAIAGRYRSDTTGTEATISETEDCPRLSTVGRFGSAVHDLECLADGVWRTKPVNAMILPARGILSFDDDGRTFCFSNSLTRALPFRRCA